MNRAMKEKKAYWIGGTVTGFMGIALVRLVAPELAGVAASFAIAAGFALVTAGIAIIACATRRKPSEAFITVETDAKDSERR